MVAVLFLLEPQASGWTFECSQAGKNGSSLCSVIGDVDWTLEGVSVLIGDIRQLNFEYKRGGDTDLPL